MIRVAESPFEFPFWLNSISPSDGARNKLACIM